MCARTDRSEMNAAVGEGTPGMPRKTQADVMKLATSRAVRMKEGGLTTRSCERMSKPLCNDVAMWSFRR
jgi:hypothetical protein